MLAVVDVIIQVGGSEALEVASVAHDLGEVMGRPTSFRGGHGLPEHRIEPRVVRPGTGMAADSADVVILAHAGRLAIAQLQQRVEDARVDY